VKKAVTEVVTLKLSFTVSVADKEGDCGDRESD
jgi:hypothetical protein